ncbi:hypothetical protein AgCh_025615 [Apium graveolens]
MGTRARGKIGESNTSFNDLPEEMAAFIFTKLPVKYLIRSTSVSKTCSNTLYLWNPCLRKYKCIESTCFSADLFLDSGKRSSVIGLGFHERTNDYRVIRIVSCVDNKNVLVSKVVPKVEVFSLRMNEWREIQNPIGPRLSLFKFRKTVNSIMYGLSSSHPEKYSDEVGILSFDFNNEVFGQLKLPDDVRRRYKHSPFLYMADEERRWYHILD